MPISLWGEYISTIAEGDLDEEVAACSGFPSLQELAKQMYSTHILKCKAEGYAR